MKIGEKISISLQALLDEQDNYIELLNEDGEEDELFMMTHQELDIARFMNLEERIVE